MRFGMGEVYFGRTATHFANIVILFTLFGEHVRIMPMMNKIVCVPKACVKFSAPWIRQGKAGPKIKNT